MTRAQRRPHNDTDWQFTIGRLILAAGEKDEAAMSKILADVGRQGARQLAVGTAACAAQVIAEVAALTGDDWKSLLGAQLNGIELDQHKEETR